MNIFTRCTLLAHAHSRAGLLSLTAACMQAINRTKQKASRERKQEYIAELEAKVRSYEQGDGERASFFQVGLP